MKSPSSQEGLGEFNRIMSPSSQEGLGEFFARVFTARVFLTRILIFLLICLLLDQLTGSILRKYYFTTTSGDYHQTIYSMDSTKADIIILGSSRASHHYVPEVIEEKLKMTCYNTGRDGSFLIYNYAVLKEITKRYNPKLVILDINPEEMYYDKVYYEELYTLLPFYKGRPELHSIIKLKGKFESLKLLSAIYPFNSTLYELIKENSKSHEIKDKTLKGYIPLFGNDTSKFSNIVLKSQEFDTTKIKILNELADQCKDKGIKLLVVKSPRYKDLNEVAAENEIIKILSPKHIPFLNYSNDSLFRNTPSLFRDGGHLNDKGAKVFTEKLAKELL